MQPQLFPSTHGQRQKPDVLRRIKDPGSAITHGIGFVLSFIAAIPLISLAIHSGDIRKVIAMSVFSLSMMALRIRVTIGMQAITIPLSVAVVKAMPQVSTI